MGKTNIKKFDSVKISLDIKRKLFSENKSLSTSEYLKKLSAEAKNIDLYKKRGTAKSRTSNQIPSAKLKGKRKSFDAVNWVREVRKDIYRASRKKK